MSESDGCVRSLRQESEHCRDREGLLPRAVPFERGGACALVRRGEKVARATVDVGELSLLRRNTA